MTYDTVEQLLMDDGFLAWYHHVDEREADRWNQWIAASPENQLLAEEAVRWLATFSSLEAGDAKKAFPPSPGRRTN